MIPPENTALPKAYFTPAEIAERWRLSVDTVIRQFEQESGVLILENPSSKSRRRYRTMRIPHSVLLRVEKERSVVIIANKVYDARRS